MHQKPIDLLGFGPRRSAVCTEGGVWHVTVKPPAMFNCGPGGTVELTADQYERYQSWLEGGGLIQVILPELSEDELEILISGITPEIFAEISSR